MEPSEHLFRHEAGRMVATLTRIFGTHNLALAEDVVQDAFCRAFEVWKLRGVPENPSAWLKATAKNLRDVFRSGDGTSGIHLIYWHNATSSNWYVTRERQTHLGVAAGSVCQTRDSLRIALHA